ncbi:MAG: glycosyltransferase family 4 protein [Nitrospira sp.]
MSVPQIYFYPHAYLRDRHLDTIRNWPREQVINPWVADRKGAQVNAKSSLSKSVSLSWKQRLPLMNLKCRPKDVPCNGIVYVWGGVIGTGPFIVDLDNPYALTGYNIRAMSIYRFILDAILSSPRCLEIRCLSNACKQTLGLLFSDQVCRKARVCYPHLPKMLDRVEDENQRGCRFLFVGTQFELKGGPALLRAFRRVYETNHSVSLTLITHLSLEYRALAESCPGVTVHEARFTREEIWGRFMKEADVLVHPTYIESFGMVVLEALSHGLAVIATDVYALEEMVIDGENGFLLKPPISVWDGVKPSRYHYDWKNFKRYVQQTDTTTFEQDLEGAMVKMLQGFPQLLRMKQASIDLFIQRFGGVGRRKTVQEIR